MSPLEQLALDPPVHPTDVSATRSDAVYGTHAYHTKVPPSVIEDFIERYTEPGDVVLDPFCGSGMTGVAAAGTGRRAVLGDLSPAAVHIARNYTSPCDPAAFRAGVERVLDRVGGRIASLYATTEEGRPAVIEHVVWSDVRACPQCQREIVLWDHRDRGLRRLTCPSCGSDGPKSRFKVVGEKAVEVSVSNGRRAQVKRPPRDGETGASEISAPGPWFPTQPFGPERPMWRRGHEELGIVSVADFFSPRNLTGLSLLWEASGVERDERVRDALRFSITAIINRASRRYQWNAKRPTNVLGGTLYISSLRYEWNVLSLWRRKTRSVERLFAERPLPQAAVRVERWSASALPLADNSVDYCFTDPPFGAHIVYSDSSLLWESWLDDLTDREQEAIVVGGGDMPKDLSDYESRLGSSFAEIRRVLRPGGHATVIFQATDPDVWRAIQEAAAGAGLHLVEANALDKGQPSFKQIKGRSGERVAAADVILTFTESPSDDSRRGRLSAEEAVRATLADVRGANGAVTGRLYASVNARLLASGAPEILAFGELERLLEAHAVETESGWKLSA